MELLENSDLYEVLQVSPFSSFDSVKHAYERLIGEIDPSIDDQASRKLQEISYAYDILSNPETRHIYDNYGMDGVRDRHPSSSHSHDASQGNFFRHIFGHSVMSHNHHGFFGHRRGRRKCDDIVHPLQVTLEDLYNGLSTEIDVNRTVICSQCKGKGGKSGKLEKCSQCDGHGIKVSMSQVGAGIFEQIQTLCPSCYGEGRMMAEKDRCKSCSGRTVTRNDRNVTVNIKPGSLSSQQIRLDNQGNEMPDMETGDIIVYLQQKPHETFRRSKDDLFCTLNIGLSEALCGFRHVLKHLDRRSIVIDCQPSHVIQPGSFHVVNNEGMPLPKDPQKKGKLFIKFDIDFPDKDFLDSSKLAVLKKLLPVTHGADPVPNGENVEEVQLIPYAANIDPDSDDTHHHHHHHGPQIQCAEQ